MNNLLMYLGMAITVFSVAEALVCSLIFSSRRTQAANSSAGFTSSDATYILLTLQEPLNAFSGSVSMLMK